MREFLKSIARCVALLLVLPELLSYWLRSGVLGRDRALEGSSQLLALVPGLLGQYVRRAFYRCVLAQCHATATIEFGTVLSQTQTRFEENVYVGPHCHLGLVHLQRDVMLAAGVHIPSGPRSHGIDDSDCAFRDQPGERVCVTVGAGTWIGCGAVILADIGIHSVVGAGAVVTKSVPDRVLVAGVPAALVRKL